MANVGRSWDTAGCVLLRDFWYTRRQWFYYRTRSCVAAGHYEKLMLSAASRIVDAGYVTHGPMPRVRDTIRRVGQSS